MISAACTAASRANNRAPKDHKDSEENVEKGEPLEPGRNLDISVNVPRVGAVLGEYRLGSLSFFLGGTGLHRCLPAFKVSDIGPRRQMGQAKVISFSPTLSARFGAN